MTCSAVCAQSTVGDRRASANASKVALGCAFFNQVVSMTLKQSSVLSQSLVIVSNVSGSMLSSNPILNQHDLAGHAARWTLPRSRMVRESACLGWQQ